MREESEWLSLDYLGFFNDETIANGVISTARFGMASEEQSKPKCCLRKYLFSN